MDELEPLELDTRDFAMKEYGRESDWYGSKKES